MMKTDIQIVSIQDEVLKQMKSATFHLSLDRFRDPDQQQRVLLEALSPEVVMCLAVKQQEIVGYTIVLRPEPEERWAKLDFIRVLGVIEVAPSYRGKGLAKQLVYQVTSPPQFDDKIIVSLEYYWHWDLQSTAGDMNRYQVMLKSLLSWSGFEEYPTTDPDIAGYSYNFMMARIGKHVTNGQLRQFIKLAHPNAIP